MSQKQAKYITTNAFPEPNYTQTPNNFFDMLPDMEHSEVNVTLVMIRNTFGFHRTEFKMGLGKLADAAGLSRNAAKDGAEAAEKRGTFKRTNPDSLGEAEWELVIGQPVTTLHSVTGDGQPVTTDRSTSDQQVGIKEIKEIKQTIPVGEVFKSYQANIGMLTPILSEKIGTAYDTYLAEWIIESFEIAVSNNARNWGYCDAILKRWETKGKDTGKKSIETPLRPEGVSSGHYA